MITGTSRRLLIPPRSGALKIINRSQIYSKQIFSFPHPFTRLFTMSHINSYSNGRKEYKKVLNIDDINPVVVAAQYAVRGELALRANALTEELKKGATNLPFQDVVHCEIGNPQALDQKPLSFIRQVN